MKQEAKRLLTVNVLYAAMPLLLILLPKLLDGVQMTAYGAAYSAYMLLVEFCVIALPALIFMLLPSGRSTAQAFWRRKPSAAILLIVPLSVCMYFAMNGLTIIWFLLLNLFGITQMPQSVPSPQNGAQLLIGLLLIALTPAVCEEFFFRGVLQPALHKNMKPAAAIVLGGCMFGLVHGQIVAMPAHVLLGICFCLVAYWTRSVWYTMLWHVMQNGIAVALSYFSEQILQMSGGADASAAMMTEQPGMMLLSAGMMLGVFGIGAAVLLAVLLLVTHKQHQENRPAQTEEKAPIWAYAPWIAAVCCIVYMYITGTIPLMGGGA